MLWVRHTNEQNISVTRKGNVKLKLKYICQDIKICTNLIFQLVSSTHRSMCHIHNNMEKILLLFVLLLPEAASKGKFSDDCSIKCIIAFYIFIKLFSSQKNNSRLYFRLSHIRMLWDVIINHNLFMLYFEYIWTLTQVTLI